MRHRLHTISRHHIKQIVKVTRLSWNRTTLMHQSSSSTTPTPDLMHKMQPGNFADKSPYITHTSKEESSHSKLQPTPFGSTDLSMSALITFPCDHEELSSGATSLHTCVFSVRRHLLSWILRALQLLRLLLVWVLEGEVEVEQVLPVRGEAVFVSTCYSCSVSRSKIADDVQSPAITIQH